ncbi:hypothetical protein Gbfr_007_269 [Gluconobacter frateurii M-2]|nr:hypothetical protein Gbfr_007_269 [Gluconobacter frateurii M-2]
MGRQCTICAYPLVRDIDRALIDPHRTYLSVAEAFPGTHAKALERHHKTHLIPRLQKVDGLRQGDAEEAIGLLAQMDDLRERAMKLLKQAEDGGNTRTALAAVKEIRGVLDSLARITGEGTRTGTGTGTVINVFNAPAWVNVQTNILTALTPFPEARAAVVKALAQTEHD